ncbi:hypothetical protein PPC_4152 [Pseudomonas protegens Cab57]|nr:hypothetical protein PPC_4152 [Pseudomonas protegens Cab57]
MVASTVVFSALSAVVSAKALEAPSSSAQALMTLSPVKVVCRMIGWFPWVLVMYAAFVPAALRPRRSSWERLGRPAREAFLAQEGVAGAARARPM